MRSHWVFGVVIVLSLLVPAVSGYPQLDYYVTDDVGVLLSDEIYLIEQVCSDMYYETGVEMAILIVNDTGDDDITLFAVKTFEENGIGQEGEDNGLLFIIVTGTDEWRIEVGYGLQGTLPAILVHHIAEDNLEPAMAQGDYFTGIGSTVAELADEILENYDGEPVKKTSPYPISWLPLTGFQLLLVGVVIIVMIITKGQLVLWILPFLGGGSGRKKWGGGRSGGGGSRGKL